MAKIRVAQIKDLSLTTTDGGVSEIKIGTLPNGTPNTIIPLTTVATATAEDTDANPTSVITSIAQSGNTITPKTTTFADVVSGGLVLTPAEAGTGVITSLTKSGNTLTAVYTNNSSALTATNLTVMSGYTQDANGSITGTTTKSFNTAQFAEDENNVISLHQNVLNASTYLGKDAIAITTIAGGNDAGKKQVALTIDTADQVLTQGENGLKANVTLAYGDVTEGERTYKAIQLVGKNGTISTIDATAFIKDGMLSEATIVRGSIVDGTFTPAENGTHYIKLVWNTDAGKQDMYVPAETLVDSYTQGNEWITIDQSANTISHAEIGDAGTYAGGDNVVVNSTATKTFTVPTFTVDAAGHVVSVDEKTVTITLPASIDTAVQTVTSTETVNATDKFVAVHAVKTGTDVVLTSEVETQAVATATAEDNGLATALDVKTYVDNAVATASHVHVTQDFVVSDTVTSPFTLTAVPYAGFEVVVYQNGIALNVREYTVSGSTVTLGNLEVALEAGDVIKVSYFKANA